MRTFILNKLPTENLEIIKLLFSGFISKYISALFVLLLKFVKILEDK